MIQGYFCTCIGILKLNKMKKIIIALVFVASVIAVQAKEKDSKSTSTSDATATTILKGTVADENSGEALVGVEIKLEGTDLKTYTDFDGNFSFSKVKPGEYKVVANYISYEKKSETLQVSPEKNELKIKLQTSN
jgi:protocatechuate 3,4-dioxygenase beta subunit